MEDGATEVGARAVGRSSVAGALTYARMGLAVPVVAAMASAGSTAGTVAVALFVAAALTDTLDGFVARRYGHVSFAGARADLLADQILVTGPLVILPLYGAAPAWWAWSLLALGWAVLGLRYAQGEGFRACVAGGAMTAVVMASVAAALASRAGLAADRALPVLMPVSLAMVAGAAIRYLILGVGGVAPEAKVVPRSAKQLALHIALAPVAAMLAVYMLVVNATMRMKVVGREYDGLVEKAGAQRMYAALHGRSMTTLARHRGRGMAVLAGINTTGAVGAMMTALLGYVPIRLDLGGRRSVVEAAQKMTEWVQAGGDACLLVDGPYGPAGEPKPLAVSVARRTGATVVPVVSDAAPSIVLRRRWDEFQMPLPFCRAVAVYCEPMTVGDDIDAGEAEVLRARLAEALRDAKQRAAEGLANWR